MIALVRFDALFSLRERCFFREIPKGGPLDRNRPHYAKAALCGIFAARTGFRLMKARTSERNQSRFLGVDVGASEGNPGIFTITSLACLKEHRCRSAMS